MAVSAAAVSPVSAQAQQLRGDPTVLTPALSGVPSSAGTSLLSPGPSLTAPLSTTPLLTPLPGGPPLGRAQEATLSLAARFGKDMPQITGALDWRVYSDKPQPGGGFRLVKEEKAASPTFTLPSGGYIVHVAFGLASAVKPVQIHSNTRETFEIAAGALQMQGRVGDAKIPPNQILFDVFKGSQFEPSDDKRLIAHNVQTGALVLVPEGTYYIVSNYGDGNATVRSDVRVETGKLTDVTVTHRAAVITLKLVGEAGGEALANTAWSVLTPAGDVIKESIGAFPRVVLAEGEYRAIARNEGKVYDRSFKVITGVDGEVEVLAH